MPAKKQQKDAFLPQVLMSSAEEIDFNTLVEEIVCIPLESAKSAYFNGCWKLEEYKDRFYLYSFNDMSLSIFSDKGIFLRQIKGDIFEKRFSDIYIHKQEDQLWVLHDRNYISKYSLDGEFISREELPFVAVDMIDAGSNEYLFFDGNLDKNAPGYIRLSNMQKTADDPFFIQKNKEIRQYGYFPSSLFTTNEEQSQIYALVHYRDTIYSFDTKTERRMKPLLHLDFEGRMLTDPLFPKEGFSDKAFADIMGKYIHSIDGFHHAAGKFFFRTQGIDPAYYILDLAHDKTMRTARLFDDIEGPYASPCGSKGNWLYTVFSANTLCTHYANRPSIFPAINELMQRLTPDDNNVIVKIKIKD